MVRCEVWGVRRNSSIRSLAAKFTTRFHGFDVTVTGRSFLLTPNASRLTLELSVHPLRIQDAARIEGLFQVLVQVEQGRGQPGFTPGCQVFLVGR